MRDELIRKSWDANAVAWTAAVRERWIESRNLATDAAVIAAVLRTSPRTVLDVGCGEGWLARDLAMRGINVLGVDSSAELIARARDLGGAQFAAVSYEAISSGDWTASGRVYEAVVCNFSLFDDDLVPLLSALRRGIVDRGRLILQTVHPLAVDTDQPYVDGWREESFAAIPGPFERAMPWYFRTLGSWVSQIRASGFHIMECEEPLHPNTGRPLSLLLVCESAS